MLISNMTQTFIWYVLLLRMMKTEDQHSVCFVAVATERLITHHCLLSILDGLYFMFGEKHWTRGAIKCLDILMEGIVDC